ncbi:hypothetical protein [Sphingopyxis macrogoltabida]|uniref:HTH cro/C1-type domain-containing protein n=1 Tax=Sphingopyxis macrogoltabida TaxID=33050 RepID=A0A0N9V5D1_SPHMC|nr:hypothetical protein [Sphingopyxis macrogoltabida]ALH82929.1 hypothetical protein AN936_21995 [Sphingopyxis macrogoltabida]
MTLLEHIRDRGLTVPEAAAELSVSHHTIHKLAYRQRQPSLKLALKIVAWSNGALTEADLVLPEAEVAA